MEKIKLITIDHEEYLDLLKYREMVQEAKKQVLGVSHNQLSYTAVQRIASAKLFDYLSADSSVGKIELLRDQNG